MGFLWRPICAANHHGRTLGNHQRRILSGKKRAFFLSRRSTKRVRRFASSGIDQHRLKELQSPVTGMQVAILKLLSEAGTIGIKSGELRIRLETSRQLLSYHMKQLSEREFVKSTGRGRAVRWNLLSEGRKHLESATHLSEV